METTAINSVYVVFLFWEDEKGMFRRANLKAFFNEQKATDYVLRNNEISREIGSDIYYSFDEMTIE